MTESDLVSKTMCRTAETHRDLDSERIPLINSEIQVHLHGHNAG